MNEKLISEGKSNFFDALCKMNPVTEIMRSSYAMLGWPIIFMSGETGGIVQFPAQSIGYAEYDELLNMKKDADNLLPRFRDLYNTSWNYNGSNIQLLSSESAQYPLLAYISIKRRSILVYQCVIHIPKDNVSDIEYRFFELIYQALSAAGKKQNLNESISKRKLSFDLIHLLKQNREGADVRPLTEGLKNACVPDYVVLNALFENDVRKDIFPDYFTEELYKKYPEIICAKHSDNVVILWGGIKKDLPLEDQINSIILFCKSNSVTLGISSVFSDISKLKSYYQQAYLTACTGMRIHPATGIHYYEDLEPLQMFYPLTGEYSLTAFLHPAVSRMIEWDEKNGTEYLKTLRAYMVSNKNNKESALLLSIHQNTLLYRLQKIRDLFGIDFDDGKLNLTLLVDMIFILVKKPELLGLILYKDRCSRTDTSIYKKP